MKAPDTLREAALHPRPERILGFELGCLLSLACGLDGLVVGLGPDGELPWGVFRRGAHLPCGTDATGGPVKRSFPPNFGEMRAISEGYLNSYFIT